MSWKQASLCALGLGCLLAVFSSKCKSEPQFRVFVDTRGNVYFFALQSDNFEVKNESGKIVLRLKVAGSNGYFVSDVSNNASSVVASLTSMTDKKTLLLFLKSDKWALQSIKKIDGIVTRLYLAEDGSIVHDLAKELRPYAFGGRVPRSFDIAELQSDGRSVIRYKLGASQVLSISHGSGNGKPVIVADVNGGARIYHLEVHNRFRSAGNYVLGAHSFDQGKCQALISYNFEDMESMIETSLNTEKGSSIVKVKGQVGRSWLSSNEAELLFAIYDIRSNPESVHLLNLKTGMHKVIWKA